MLWLRKSKKRLSQKSLNYWTLSTSTGSVTKLAEVQRPKSSFETASLDHMLLKAIKIAVKISHRFQNTVANLSPRILALQFAPPPYQKQSQCI